jgi:hypothetical protein
VSFAVWQAVILNAVGRVRPTADIREMRLTAFNFSFQKIKT